MGAILLAGSLASLWFAATRLVSSQGIAGLPRFLAVSASVAATMMAEGLALGLVGLGTEPAALLASSLALALLAAALLPAVERPARAEILEAWEAAGGRERVAAGAAAGLLVMWGAVALVEPALDFDSTFFHLPEVSAWVIGGHPGSIEPISPTFPIGNYPSTNEVLMSWLGGTSGGVTAVLLWPLWLATLLAAAVLSASRSLGAGRWDGPLAAAAFLLVPACTAALTSLDSDLASVAWAAVCVGLCAPLLVDRDRVEVAPFAIVAAGLALGTKTSVAPLVVLVLGGALLHAGRRLRPVPVAAGSLVACVAGGVWYVRNLLEHGNPLWPFVDLPVGDPPIAAVSELDGRFIEHPLGTLDGRVGDYLDALGPGPLLLAAAILLPLLSRDRRLMLGSGIVAIGVLAWSLAPVTGDPGSGPQAAYFSVTGVRYLLSAILGAVIVLAMVAGRGGGTGAAARAVLAASVVWGLAELLGGGDALPTAGLVLAAAVAGGLSGLALGRLGTAGAIAPVAAASLAIAVALIVYPDRFVERYADGGGSSDPVADTRVLYADLAGWFEEQPRFRDGGGPVAMSNVLVGPLTGGGFDHPLRLLSDDASCGEIRTRASGGWAVLTAVEGATTPALECFAGETPLRDESGLRVFAVPRVK